MKGLAIYSLILISITELAMIAELCQGININDNVWGIGLFLPILIFAIGYLRKGNK